MQAVREATGQRVNLQWRNDAAIRRLGSADRAEVLEHLCALGPSDQAMRFGCALSRDAIARYVDGLDFGRDITLAAADAAGNVIGLAQILPLGPAEADAEIAFSVLPAWRGRGLGRRLMQAACWHARRCGVRRLMAQVRASNRPMLAVLEGACMRFERDRGEVFGMLELPAGSVRREVRSAAGG